MVSPGSWLGRVLVYGLLAAVVGTLSLIVLAASGAIRPYPTLPIIGFITGSIAFVGSGSRWLATRRGKT